MFAQNVDKAITSKRIMRFSSYIKDKLVPLLIVLMALIIVALALWAYDVELLIVGVVCVVLIAAIFVSSIWDYLARRRFYQDLEEGVKIKGNAYYATEFVDRPSFVEGRIVYDSLERATKDMNDRIAQYRLASEEYQEYVETWIHEVKNPLAASRLILGNLNNPGLCALEHELDRIESSVEQALYYARSSAVENDYLLKAICLDAVVKGAIKKQSRLLIEQGIAPSFEGLETQVYADPKWLDFILGQIIANVAKYSRPHAEGHIPKIVFSAEHCDAGFESDKVLLSIADNGMGIPSHDLGRVFEKGFTGENGRLYAKSTGIGLYLCSKLCAQMKLKISLESKQYEGTVVKIEFPLNKMYFLN